MQDSFELEFQRKLTKMREELSRKEVEVRSKLADAEKVRVEALKKTEEMKYTAQHELIRIDQEIVKIKNLDAQLKSRLTTETASLRNDVEKKYAELRNAILGKPTQ